MNGKPLFFSKKQELLTILKMTFADPIIEIYRCNQGVLETYMSEGIISEDDVNEIFNILIDYMDEKMEHVFGKEGE